MPEDNGERKNLFGEDSGSHYYRCFEVLEVDDGEDSDSDGDVDFRLEGMHDDPYDLER